MVKFKFFLGTDSNGHDVNARAIAYELAIQHFPYGHSIEEVQGYWLSQSGPVNELTIVVTWLALAELVSTGEADARANGFAQAFKNAAFQESVLVERHPVDAFFV